MSKRNSQHVGWPRHFMSSGMVRMTDFDDMTGQHSQYFPEMLECWWQHVIWGASRHNTMPTFPTKFREYSWGRSLVAVPFLMNYFKIYSWIEINSKPNILKFYWTLQLPCSCVIRFSWINGDLHCNPDWCGCRYIWLPTWAWFCRLWELSERSIIIQSSFVEHTVMVILLCFKIKPLSQTIPFSFKMTLSWAKNQSWFIFNC